MIRLAIFDYNGTLADDATTAWKIVNHMHQWHGKLPITFERFRATFDVPWLEFYRHNGVIITDVKAHQEEYVKEIRSHSLLVKPRKGVVETLREFKRQGVKLAVLTFWQQEELEQELKSMGIKDTFDLIVGEKKLHETGASQIIKDPAKIMQHFNIAHPKEVLFVGDLTVDVKTAKQHGFVSVGLANGWQTKEKLATAEPDFLFDEFDEILELFNGK